MRRAILLLGGSVAVLALFFLHLGFAYVLPYPYQLANVLLAGLVLMLMATNSGKVVWIAAALYWCLELYTVTSFGVVFVSCTMSMLVTYWLYQSLITNRTLPAVAALAGTSLIGYRVCYTVGLLLTTGAPTDWGAYVTTLAWELLMTVIFTTILFVILRRWLRSLRTDRAARSIYWYAR